MGVAVEREDAVRCPVVDDRVGVFRRGNPAERFERLQIEHDDRLVVAGRGKSMSRRRGNRRPVRALNARHFANERPVVYVDKDNGTLVGEVTGIQGAHGTAIAAATGHGFATSGNDQSVVMFDLKTFKALGRIPAAEDADAIIYDGASNRVFTFNGDAHSSTVIDPREGKLITNIPLGGKPEYGASAGDGKVYANLTDTSEVVEIDAKTATVARRWSTAPCKQPVAMAIDTAHHRLFSGCRSGVMAVSDYQAGKVVATVPIGPGVDGAGFDAASGNVFASNADGTLTVIHQDSPDQY